jgi:integrase
MFSACATTFQSSRVTLPDGPAPCRRAQDPHADIKDGALLVRQNKPGKKVRFAVEGDLSALVERVKAKKVTSLRLISTEEGTPITKYELRGAFDRARDAAVLAHPHREAEIRKFQFRDLRAEAGTDTEALSGMAAAQDQLGHSTSTMTAHYVRHRRGKLIKPTKKG